MRPIRTWIISLSLLSLVALISLNLVPPTSARAGGPNPAATPTATSTNQCRYRILVLSSESTAPGQLQSELLNLADVYQVDWLPVGSSTPTLSQLQAYDEVYFYSYNAVANPAALGSVLADYVDGGGVVATGFFAFDSGSNLYLTGRWQSDGYSPFDITSNISTASTSLGVYTSTEPLMNGVSTLNAGSRTQPPLANGAVSVALYQDGGWAVGYKVTGGHTVVGLPVYLGSSGGRGAGDYARVLVNAARWLKPLCQPTATTTNTPTITPTSTPTPCGGLAPAPPHLPVNFINDDGTPEQSLQGSGVHILLTRFQPTSNQYPINLSQISIMWPDNPAAVGQPVYLLVYLDADANGDPSNAVKIAQISATVSIANGQTFQTYNVNVTAPGPGDLYIGYSDLFNPTTSRFYSTMDSESQTSWLTYNLSGNPNYDNLAANDVNIGINTTFIRASGSDARACPTATSTATLTPTRTATPRPPTATPTSTPPPATATPTCLIGQPANGGFESGAFSPWVISDTVPPPLVTTDNPFDGQWSARVGIPASGGTEPNGDSSFYQNITIPAGQFALLSFFYWPYSDDNIADDWQDAYITDQNGNLLLSLLHTNANNRSWLLSQTNLAAFGGQTVRLVFSVHENGNGLHTGMYVDDVILYTATPTCTPSQITPTYTPTIPPSPTATATASVTASATPSPTATPAPPSNTATATPRPTSTDTPVLPTNTATDTPLPTQTPGGPTATPAPPSNTATATPRPTSTDTPVLPTNTATDTPAPTQTPGGPTATPVPPTSTATDTPAATDTPLPSVTATPVSTNTPAGPTATPAPPTVTPTDCANPFVDISGNVFYGAIHYLACRGAVNGTDASHYSPGGTSTRGQFAKVVVKGFGVPSYTPTIPDFSDVPPTYFAFLYIESGYHAAILSGFDAGSCAANHQPYPCYLPNLAITRGQLTKLVVNAARYQLYTPSGGQQSFTDVPPSNVFFASIETAHNKGVINGYADHTFRPNNNIRRDEMAQIVYKGVTTP